MSNVMFRGEILEFNSSFFELLRFCEQHQVPGIREAKRRVLRPNGPGRLRGSSTRASQWMTQLVGRPARPPSVKGVGSGVGFTTGRRGLGD